MDTEKQFEEWYPDCKVYFDGNAFIAVPKTHNRAKRRKPKRKVITVKYSGDNYELVKEPNERLEDFESDEPTPFDEVQLNFKDIDSQSQQYNKSAKNFPNEPQTKRATRKEIFDGLYDKYLSAGYAERKRIVYEKMRPLFRTDESASGFIEENLKRRRRNVIVRRQRFARKAYNQKFQYFVTFTYDDKKLDEKTFRKKLIGTLSNFARRKGWLYMGVWERGKESDRLHFHGLLYAPEGTMTGEFEQVTDYNKKTGKRKTIVQNTFFAEKFGRNEFEEIGGPVYGLALAYIMKYMEKQNATAVYSKGLYRYFHTDICSDDIICKLKPGDKHDNRLILFSDFTCANQGELLGKVSPEIIAKLPKTI